MTKKKRGRPKSPSTMTGQVQIRMSAELLLLVDERVAEMEAKLPGIHIGRGTVCRQIIIEELRRAESRE
jgi:hypothetical protein